MPGPYPTAYDSLIVPTDGVTNIDAVWGDPITYAVLNQQTYVGLSGDTASAVGTLTARIKQLQADLAALALRVDYATPNWIGGD